MREAEVNGKTRGRYKRIRQKKRDKRLEKQERILPKLPQSPKGHIQKMYREREKQKFRVEASMEREVQKRGTEDKDRRRYTEKK